MQIHHHSEFEHSLNRHGEEGLRKLLDRLVRTMQQDELVRQTTNQLKELLQVDRVVLYYFYKWQGQVTFESLSSEKFSILGFTGPDDCFKDEYADSVFSRKGKSDR